MGELEPVLIEATITKMRTVKPIPPLTGTVQSLRVAVGVPDQEDRMTMDVFIMAGDREFRWPLTPMQYVIIGEAIAAMVNLPLDYVKVLSVDPLAEGHTYDGETENYLSLPPRFYENNRPPYEDWVG